MKTVYNVGIYCRLSREDLKNGKRDTSSSIENQQAILKKYVSDMGWSVYKIYIDDGVSGTTFDREGFQSMFQDIEDGKINCVITKDLSRLGRNYIESGLYRERFLDRNVRYVAISDNYDSEVNGEDTLSTVLKELMNQTYAEDISRKVRLTKKMLAEQGKFSNSRAPYGYMKSPENKHLLIIDMNVSHNVERIFDLYLSGTTGRGIAEIFNREGITTPNEYYYNTIGKPNPYKNNKNMWGSGTIMNIIKNPIYRGAMANGKRKVTSFKNKRVIQKSADEWIIVEGTHEPIISGDLWHEAQKIHAKNHKESVRRLVNGEMSLFSGIIKCTDCGGNLAYTHKVFKSGISEFYKCSTYNQKGKHVCTPHKIDFDVLCKAVLTDVQRYAVLAVEDEKKLIDRILKANDEFKNKNLQRYEKNIRESKNRIKEIDGIIMNLYEDKRAGEIKADIFNRMSQKYSEEQTTLIADVEQLESELAECKRVEQDLTGWIKRVKECLTIDVLTRTIVVELIDRIEVSEIYSTDGEKNLDINIFYKFSRLSCSRAIAS